MNKKIKTKEFSMKGYEYLEKEEENLAWLELDNIPKKIHNPLYELDNSDQIAFAKDLMRLSMKPDYLHIITKYILGYELLPFQLAILDLLWRKKYPMLIAGRGSGKSFLMAVYVYLRLLTHPGCKIVVIGAALRQSRGIYDFMVTIMDKSPILHDIIGGGKNGPKQQPDRLEFRIGDSIAYFLPLGTGEKIRGYRANYIIADEYASISNEIFNVTVRGFASTSADPVEKVKRRALINELKKTGQYSEEMENKISDTFEGNQIIITGTAYYHFNHFYKDYLSYRKIIEGKGNLNGMEDVLKSGFINPKGFDWKNYGIARLGYNHLPEDFFDEGMIYDAKINSNSAQFNMEYGGIFSADTDGFFKRSLLESATCYDPIVLQNGEKVKFLAKRSGDADRSYVVSLDPAAVDDNAALVILEDNPSHRKIVYCWTTNKKKYDKLRSDPNLKIPQDYYKYLARKIRDVMKVFNVTKIVMDFHGGGLAVSEALGDPDNLEPGEKPIYQEIVDGEEKYSDTKEGLHILRFVKAYTEMMSSANHGLKKDFEQKTLIFPAFDTIEAEKQLILEGIVDNPLRDSYESIALEIEDLKTEITNIVCTPTGKMGQEHFDTPEFKINNPNGVKKGKLRKDRYSALLYANWYIRERDKTELPTLTYTPLGGSMESYSNKSKENQGSGSMYYGPGMAKIKNSNYIKFRK